MPPQNFFEERQRGLENEYFHKKERELIEKMRAKVAREEDLQHMQEATGVADQEVLEALQDLGYTSDTIRLLSIVPLLQIAWAEGGVTDDERKMILEIANSRGITEGAQAYQQLMRWLETEPPQEFFDNTLRAVSYMIEALPPDQRQSSRQNLVEYCTQIAEVSGGILGFRKISDEERMLIARIATEIGQNRPVAVKQMLEG